MIPTTPTKPTIRAFFDSRPGLEVTLYVMLVIAIVVGVLYAALAPAQKQLQLSRQCTMLCQPAAREVVDGECLCQRADGSWRSFREPN